MRYDALGRVASMQEGGAVTRFTYAPDGSLYRQERAGEVTYVVGHAFEYTVGADRLITKRTYVGDYLVIENRGGQRSLRYLHRDRLGSIAAITDESGAVLERRAYDAFGLPRAADGTDAGGRLYADGSGRVVTRRGFTDHTHLDAHRLIHMGGRVYDPVLGRFLSVDPVIQDPANSQSLHPYSYVRNNPFAGIDPTGENACNWLAGRYVCLSPDNPGMVEGPFLVPIDEPSQPNGQQGQGVDAQSSGPSVEAGSTDQLDGVRAFASVAKGVTAAARFAWGMIEGAGQGVTEMVTGTAQMVMHPMVTLESLAFAVQHPVQVTQAIWADVRSTARELASGDPHAWGRAGVSVVGVVLSPSYSTGLVVKGAGAIDESVDVARITVGSLREAGLKDAHHIIQDAAAKSIPGYHTNAAPGVHLPGPATTPGTPHYYATQVQRQRGTGTYASERRIGYKALRRAGLSPVQARELIQHADAYFRKLGVIPSTAMRPVRNRR